MSYSRRDVLKIAAGTGAVLALNRGLPVRHRVALPAGPVPEGHPLHRRAHPVDRSGNGEQLLPRGSHTGGMLWAMTLIVALQS